MSSGKKQKSTPRAIELAAVFGLLKALWKGRITMSGLDGLVRLDGQPVRKLDVVRVRMTLERETSVRTRLPDVRCALDLVAADNFTHPVRDWLATLVPDATARVDRVLIDYFGADDTALNRKLGAAWLIGACARVFEPGCGVDGALVLISSGGAAGAAGALAALVPDPRWLGEAPIDIGSKDALVQVHGSWFFHLAENASLAKARPDARKAFLCRSVDRFRQQFGSNIEDHPRQAVFVATTSLETWAQAPMVGSDLWTVVVGDADVEGLRRDRGQLFAEALARYGAAESRRLDDADLVMLAAMQRQLLDASPGEERLEAWVRRQDQPFTALGAASSGLGLEIEDRKVEGIKQRVGKLLGEMGCTKTRPRDDEGHRQWLWKRPAKWGLVL